MSHETETYTKKDYRIKCNLDEKEIICFIEFDRNSEKTIRLFFKPDEFAKKLEKVIKQIKKGGKLRWKR